MIRALIFDFDGLMMDTELPEYEAWQTVYQMHRQELPLNVWAQVLGSSNSAFDLAGHLQELVDYPLDPSELHRQHDEIADLRIDALGLLPGVRELVLEASTSGMHLGVASSSHREWVTSKLARHGLLDHFSAVWTADDVEHVKPAPDLYLRCTADLGVSPAEAIALEDSPNGITAAKAAGLHCVVVPNQISSRLPLHHADWSVPSLAHITLDQLVHRFNGNGRRQTGK